jgi:hypothetical protein
MTRSGLTYHINKDKPRGTKMPAHMSSKSEMNEVTTLFSIAAYNQRVKRTYYCWSAPLCNALPQKWTAGLTPLMLIAVVMFMANTSTVLTGLTVSPLTQDASTTPNSSTLRDLWSTSNQVLSSGPSTPNTAFRRHARDTLLESVLNQTPWTATSVGSGMAPKDSDPAPVQVFQAPFVVKGAKAVTHMPLPSPVDFSALVSESLYSTHC